MIDEDVEELERHILLVGVHNGTTTLWDDLTVS